MMKKKFLLIGYRYLFTKQQNSTIRSMIFVSFLGIMIATYALALVVSVMEGFEQVTYQKMQSIYPDLVLDARGQEVDLQKLGPILQEKEFNIQQWSGRKTGQILLYNKDYTTNPIVTSLQGLDPHKEAQTTLLHTKKIVPTKESFQDILKKDVLFIGQKLAQNLNLSVDDTAQILYTQDEPESLSVQFQQQNVTIGGIFKTGIDDFDNNLVYCNQDYFDTFFPDQGFTQVYIKLHNQQSEQQTCSLLKKRLNVDVYSWKDLYPTLLATLKLEKYAMFFILLLIVLIASMNIISLIFMYITQKKKEIALFICFGMPTRKIKILFMSISLMISLCATICGLTLAYLSGIFLQQYPFIKLPDDAYLTTHLPIQLDPIVFCVILIASLLLSLCASIIATNKIDTFNLVQTLKQE